MSRSQAFAAALWLSLSVGAVFGGMAMAREPSQPAISTNSAAWIVLVLPAALFIGITLWKRQHPLSGLAHYRDVRGQPVPDVLTSLLIALRPLAFFAWLLFLMGASCILVAALQSGPESAYFSGGFFVSAAAGSFGSRLVLLRAGDRLG